MSYRRPSLFWPVILIGIGLIFLLNNLGVIRGNPWALIWQFWPVILIIIGLDILFGRRSAAGSLVSAVLALIVVVGLIWLLIARPNLPGLAFGGDLTQEPISHALGSTRTANVVLDFATGENRLYALGDSPNLIEGDISHYGQLDFTVSESGDRADVHVGTRGSVSIFGGFSSERWEVGLSTRPTYDIQLNLGAGQADIDLSRFKLNGGRISVGAGTAEVKLPSTGTFDLSVDGGVGELRIVAPRDIALRVEVDTGIGSFNAGSRLRSVGTDIYETEGFGTAKDAITLKIDIGVGSVTVRDG